MTQKRTGQLFTRVDNHTVSIYSWSLF